MRFTNGYRGFSTSIKPSFPEWAINATIISPNLRTRVFNHLPLSLTRHWTYSSLKPVIFIYSLACRLWVAAFFFIAAPHPDCLSSLALRELSTTSNMSSIAGLRVAIYNDGGVYKHWSLFIDGPTDAEQTILHIMGSSTNYRFEMRHSNARKSTTLSELIYLCDVPNKPLQKDWWNSPPYSQRRQSNCGRYQNWPRLR